MIQLDNTPSSGTTFICVHLPPGSYSTLYYTFTHLATGATLSNVVGVAATTTNRCVSINVNTAQLQDGMHLCEFKTSVGGDPLTTLLGYASLGGDTAVPSDPSTYTGGDSDVYKVYYE